MRKAAIIVGIICAVFLVIAAALKLLGIPGGGILMVIFSGTFISGAMLLNLGHQLKQNTDKVKRAADVSGWYAGGTMLMGLLFLAQRWPGAKDIFIQAAFAGLIYGVLFFIASKRPMVTTTWYSRFTTLYLIVVACLGVGWISAEKKNAVTDDARRIFDKELKSYVEVKSRTDSLIEAFRMDTANLELDSAANELFIHALELIEEIEEYKCGYLARLNHDEGCNGKDIAYFISKPDDIDVSTYMMVGEDVTKPAGHGIMLYGIIAVYANKKLHPDISLGIPTNNAADYKEQWVKDNFYHATAYETMTRLTQFQHKVYLSVEASISKNLFRK